MNRLTHQFFLCQVTDAQHQKYEQIKDIAIFKKLIYQTKFLLVHVFVIWT